jgi:hypothetical protein
MRIQVRLAVDGTSLGTAPVQPNLTAVFVVPYKPGKLEASCVNGTTVIPQISSSLQSAGAAAALRLSAGTFVCLFVFDPAWPRLATSFSN